MYTKTLASFFTHVLIFGFVLQSCVENKSLVVLIPIESTVPIDWKKIFNYDIEKNFAPLPNNILYIMEKMCPVNGNGKKVRDTHYLAYIPASVNDKSLSMVLFSDLLLNSISSKTIPPDAKLHNYSGLVGGIGLNVGKQLWHDMNVVQSTYIKHEQYNDEKFRDRCSTVRSSLRTSPKTGCWVLMYKGVMEASKGKTWEHQKIMFDEWNSSNSPKYTLPTVGAISITTIMYYIKTGKKIFKDDKLPEKITPGIDNSDCILTRCIDPWSFVGNNLDNITTVGSFSAEGLYVHYDYSKRVSKAVSVYGITPMIIFPTEPE